MYNKYGNKITYLDGYKFDSRKEAKHYLSLKVDLHDGKISNLRLQVPYELVPAIYEEEIKHLKTKDKIVKKCVQRAIIYVADFVYEDNVTGKTVVVDVKGKKTKEYLLKKKLMRALKGISIVEV